MTPTLYTIDGGEYPTFGEYDTEDYGTPEAWAAYHAKRHGERLILATADGKATAAPVYSPDGTCAVLPIRWTAPCGLATWTAELAA